MATDSIPIKKEKHFLTLVTGVVIGLIFIFYMFSFTVPYGNVAVLTRFGKPTKSITDPGLYFKVPLMHKVYTYDARIQVSEDRFEETYTLDQKNIIVQAYFLWQIEDPLTFLNAVGSLEKAETYIKDIVRTKRSAVFGQHNLSELVSTNQEDLHYDQIEQEILDKVRASAQKDYGISVVQIGIKQLELPEKITEKVFDRMRAERKKKEDDLLSQGEGEAARIRAQAEKVEKLILASAEARAKEIRAEGDREATKYYEVFAQNPELAIFLKEIEALREALQKKATIILDTKTPPFTLLENKPEITE